MFPLLLAAAALATPAPPPLAPTPIAKAIARAPNGALLQEGHVMRIVGVASASSGMYFHDVEKFFVQDDDGGIAIFTRKPVGEITEGDRIDVTGKITAYNGEAELLLDHLRVIRHGPPPPPIEVAPQELRSRRYAGRLVRIEAEVLEATALARGMNILLRAGDGSIICHVTSDQARLFPKELRRGTLVRVTGISSEYTRDGPPRFEILPRTPADVVLIERGPMLSRRAAWTAAAAVGAVTVLIFVWIVILRRKVRTALSEYRELDERYRFLFEDNPMPMWVCDARSKRILTINRAAISTYGFTTEEFRAMSLTDLDRTDPQGGSGPARRTVSRHRTKNGRTVFVEVLSQPIVYAGHDALIFLAIDVTEWAAAAEPMSS